MDGMTAEAVADAQGLEAIIWEADPVTFQFSYVSPGAERLFGYTLEDWLTRRTFWVDLLHPDDRERAVATCTEAVRECRDHDFEYRAIAADGRVIWIRDMVRVVCCDSGATALHGVMIDITDRKRAEAAADRTARLQGALIEHTLDVITVVDLQGVVQYQNPAAERVLGYSPNDRKGRSIFELIHPDDLERVQAVFHDSLISDQPSRLTQFQYRHADGSWRTLEAIGRTFHDEDGTRLGIITIRDVTERKQLEDQFRHAQKMEALGRLTSSVAHDFNNVLMTILGYTDLAAESEHAPGVQLELGEIKRAGELGVSLTRQLLVFSRAASGNVIVIDVNAVLSEMESMLRRLLGSSIRVEMMQMTRCATVRLARGMLEQIVMNLAINARDAMPKGGIFRVETTSAVMPEEGPDGMRRSLILTISDTGSGMAPDVLARIFEPYFTTKESGRGTGLGLSTVYGIVRDSNGQIEVESELGKGTRFRIHLPTERRKLLG